MSDAGTAPPASKRSRILRRTAVGSLLAAAVVAVLLLAAESESGRVVSGVGLALARQVMIAHGGFIRVNENDDGGATFSLTF